MCCGKYNSPPLSSENLWWLRLGILRTFLVLCIWKVLLHTYSHSYTLQRCVITMEKYKSWAKIDPISFQAGFWQNCELRLDTFPWIVSQLDCKWKFEWFFCPWPWKMQGNWENWRHSFWWSANREQFRENDFKRSSEFQKFSQENVEMFWWSANRGKICQVVRESEKVENRCIIALEAMSDNVRNAC